ncbi:MAG: zinc ribbon domain-containing protein [Romboutsia sp.]
MDNIKSKMNKSKEKFENIKEKNKFNNSIEKAQKEKLEVFANAGIYLYELVRKDEIVRSDLVSLFDGIIELDKSIYQFSTEIEKLGNQKSQICECGNLINLDSKFCSQCGKSVDVDISGLKCEFCLNNIDIGDKFCTCCGKKVLNV